VSERPSLAERLKDMAEVGTQMEELRKKHGMFVLNDLICDQLVKSFMASGIDKMKLSGDNFMINISVRKPRRPAQVPV
jgi:p-aminobenzoyl-glutamate transporter AbgT